MFCICSVFLCIFHTFSLRILCVYYKKNIPKKDPKKDPERDQKGPQKEPKRTQKEYKKGTKKRAKSRSRNFDPDCQGEFIKMCALNRWPF